jgi:hypothetical protein
MSDRAEIEKRALEAACLGKERHASEAAAEAAKGFWARHGTIRSGEVMESYCCSFCGEWHLGHPTVGTKNRPREKSRRRRRENRLATIPPEIARDVSHGAVPAQQ